MPSVSIANISIKTSVSLFKMGIQIDLYWEIVIDKYIFDIFATFPNSL